MTCQRWSCTMVAPVPLWICKSRRWRRGPGEHEEVWGAVCLCVRRMAEMPELLIAAASGSRASLLTERSNSTLTKPQVSGTKEWQVQLGHQRQLCQHLQSFGNASLGAFLLKCSSSRRWEATDMAPPDCSWTAVEEVMSPVTI